MGVRLPPLCHFSLVVFHTFPSQQRPLSETRTLWEWKEMSWSSSLPLSAQISSETLAQTPSLAPDGGRVSPPPTATFRIRSVLHNVYCESRAAAVASSRILDLSLKVIWVSSPFLLLSFQYRFNCLAVCLCYFPHRRFGAVGWGACCNTLGEGRQGHG